MLGIGAYPVNWPLGNGETFRGVYDRADARAAHLRAHRARREARAGVGGRRRTTSGFARWSTRDTYREFHRRDRAARRRGRSVRPRRDAARRRDAGVLRQRDDQLRRRAVPRPLRGAWRRRRARQASIGGPRAPIEPPTNASRRSSSRFRPTWIRAIAIASRSRASARAGSSAT